MRRATVLTYEDIIACVHDWIKQYHEPMDLRWHVVPVVRQFMRDSRDQGVVEAYLRQTLMAENSGLCVYPYLHEGKVRYAVTLQARAEKHCAIARSRKPVLMKLKKRKRKR